MAANTKQKQRPVAKPASLVGEHKVVPIRSVVPNKWNYNVESPAIFTKLVRSLRDNGFIEPIVCRRIAKAKWEIVNGEHRWRAAIEAGLTEISIIDMGEVGDTKAQSLCIIFNELGGTPDEVRLADLLRTIAADTSFEKLNETMPFPEAELKCLLESVDFSYVNMSGKDASPDMPAVTLSPDPNGTSPSLTQKAPHIALDFSDAEVRDNVKAMIAAHTKGDELSGDVLARLLQLVDTPEPVVGSGG